MAQEREVFLYMITNPVGSVYIGQSVDPKKRFIVYARNDTRCQHKLKNSISKYGWDAHKAEVITSVPESQSNYAEMYLIAWYNSMNKETGLNIMHGGAIKRTPEMNRDHSAKMRGRKQSENQRKKISASLVGNQRAKGAIRSIEFRENARKKITGIKRPSISKPVISYSIEGDFIKEYPSLISTRIDGFDHSKVSDVCYGKRNKHKGVVFKFKVK